MDNPFKSALERLARANAKGEVSDEILIKACDSYKIKSDEFVDSYEYHVAVIKSLADYLNGASPDEEIVKAVVVGQTKIVDGVVYIYTATPNAQTPYGWRVHVPKPKTGLHTTAQVAKSAASRLNYVSGLFPEDIGSLKVVKRLGGSTGAELVMDDDDNEYVMKKSSNTSEAHVREEYLSNQLYQILGLRTPDFELADNNGKPVLLSKFMSGTRNFNNSDAAEISKGYVVDALMGNWDVYQNDNILIDSAGRVVRVDNGGSLRFRAQGGLKGHSFGSKVDEIDSLRNASSMIAAVITDTEINNQIAEVLDKRDKVLGYLELVGEDELKDIMEKRFADLEKRFVRFQKKNAPKAPKVPVDPAEMYRELSEQELQDCYDEVGGHILKSNRTEGWLFLNEVCKLRGFDQVPEELSDADFDALLADRSNIYVNRGLTSSGGKSALDLVKEFSQSETCFFGQTGVYGAGIYSAVNKARARVTTDPGYREAWSGYANGHHEGVIDIIIPSDAKTVFSRDLDTQMKLEFFGPKFAAKQKEFNDLKIDQQKIQAKLSNIDQEIEDDVKKRMGWNENVRVMSQLEIDDIDWGEKDQDGERIYPTFDNFFPTIKKYVEDCGGTVLDKNPGWDNYVFTLPNSKEQFLFTRYMYENNAIKQATQFSKAYNYPVARFQNWLENNHFKVIEKVVAKEIEDGGVMREKINKELHVATIALEMITDEINSLKNTGSVSNKVMAEILKRPSAEYRGFYAAIKGYDVIIENNNPNGSGTDYAIILNRSKLKVRIPK